MSRICEICGKGTSYGNRKRHHHAVGWLYRAPRSNKSFRPNLRKTTITKEGKSQKISVCMSCYKRLHKEE